MLLEIEAGGVHFYWSLEIVELKGLSYEGSNFAGELLHGLKDLGD